MFSGISENNHFDLMQFEVAIRDLLTSIINEVYHLVDNELVNRQKFIYQIVLPHFSVMLLETDLDLKATVSMKSGGITDVVARSKGN